MYLFIIFSVIDFFLFIDEKKKNMGEKILMGGRIEKNYRGLGSLKWAFRNRFLNMPTMRPCITPSFFPNSPLPKAVEEKGDLDIDI